MIAGTAKKEEILVADEAWVGLALLHRGNPTRESFTAGEIVDRVKMEHASHEFRPGIQPHVYLHNVANLEPNSARYRMFYLLSDKTYRLYRPGDPSHPARKGKTKPDRRELPSKYHYLLDWYENEYSARKTVSSEDDDPVLKMRGVGKELWADTNADDYVRDLRSNWYGDDRDAK